MVPERIKLPLPVLVRPNPIPDTTPDSVNCVPVTLTALSAFMATVPDKLLVPVEVAKVPPLSVRASAPRVTPLRSSVAPLVTVAPPATSPKPAALVMAKVPADTVVVPLYVLVPDKSQVPAPDLVRLVAPVLLSNTWLSLLLAVLVPVSVKVRVVVPV